MAMKIRIEILSGSPAPEIPEPCSWGAKAVPAGRNPTNYFWVISAVQCHPGPATAPRQFFRGLQRLSSWHSASPDLFFQLLVHTRGMMHIGSLMDSEISAGPGISAIHLQQSAGLLLGNPRHLRFIRVKSSQRLRGEPSRATFWKVSTKLYLGKRLFTGHPGASAPMPSAKSSHSSAWPSSPARFSATAFMSSPSSCGRDSNISR